MARVGVPPLNKVEESHIMTNVVIASAARTAVGSFGGAFANTPAHDLGAAVLKELVARAGVDPSEISETILGQVLTAAQGQNPARQAHINAGLPKESAAWGINQVCGSGLRAVALAAQHIQLGDANIVAAGGQENMTLSPHAQNLRDSGVEVVIALKDGSKSAPKAQEDGFEVKSVADATAWADVIMILAPDQHQRGIYNNEIKPNLAPGKTLAFAHGFNIRFGYIEAPEGVDVILIAPKAPGHTVRREYVAGRGIPDIIAVEKDASGSAWELAKSYAKAIGGTRAGVIKTTFTEETETDLFGEQAVLCGGVSQLIQYGFETLTEAGYQPEIAYFEVLHELKLIVDLMWEGGIAKQRWSVSDTAEYGDYVSGPRVIDPHVKENMAAVLADIRSGAFAERFITDQDNGAVEFLELREKAAKHPIEAVGKDLRSLFSWKQQDSDYVEGSAAR